MIRPEDALATARRGADAARASGGYAGAEHRRGFSAEAQSEVTTAKLLEWALIEPDPDLVYSTRRLGAPITYVKRGLLRALRQYHGELLAQQTRLNIQLVAYVSRLEDRVKRLEERSQAPPGGSGPR